MLRRKERDLRKKGELLLQSILFVTFPPFYSYLEPPNKFIFPYPRGSCHLYRKMFSFFLSKYRQKVTGLSKSMFFR
jgi:hypothetical protein